VAPVEFRSRALTDEGLGEPSAAEAENTAVERQ